MYRFLLGFLASALPYSISGQIFTCVERSDFITIATVLSDSVTSTLINKFENDTISNRSCRIVLHKVCNAYWKRPYSFGPNSGDTILLRYRANLRDPKPAIDSTYFLPVLNRVKGDYWFSNFWYDQFIADSLELFDEYCNRTGAAKQLRFFKVDKQGRWNKVIEFNADSSVHEIEKTRRSRHKRIVWTKTYSESGAFWEHKRTKYRYRRNGTDITFWYLRRDGKRIFDRSKGGAYWLD